MRIFIAFLVQAALATAAFAQGAGGTVSPAAVAEAAQKALVQQHCEKDGRFMQCLGVDIKKDAGRCAELLRSNWAFCRSTFMMTAPSTIPLADASSYSDNLAGCVRSGAIGAAGKAAGAVEACMAGAR
jgi:hypothetical protein